MKTRSLFLVFFFVLMAQAVFADATNCVSLPNQPDGSGGFITAFNCNFYHESVYPFDLTSYMTNGGASLPENALVPGYIVWTTDTTDVAGQTLNDTGAFQDILDFDGNQCAGTCSSQVYLYWSTGQGGPGFPSVSTIEANPFGYAVLLWNPSGVNSISPDANHTFTVDDTLPSVPEPSTLLLVFAGGMGTLALRRRRRT